MQDFTQHIGILAVNLFIPSSQSLKSKRMVLRSLKDRVRSKFNVSVCELDGHDKWQVATLGIAIIGNDSRYVDSCLQNILSFIESFDNLEICDHEVSFL